MNSQRIVLSNLIKKGYAYLKKAEFWKKGLPYVGNKNQKAQQIINALPKAKSLVDVFGGSGAISLAAAASNRWETVIYNDKRTLVLLCWSFSNDEKGYLWSRDKEQFKLDLIQKYIVDDNHNLSINERHQKYLASKQQIRLSRMEPIDRIKRLELMQTAQVSLPIIYLNMDYSALSINGNDVIYCDPPYLNSFHRYGGFDDNRFSKWLNNLPTHNIFISEKHILPHAEVFKDLGTK